MKPALLFSFAAAVFVLLGCASSRPQESTATVGASDTPVTTSEPAPAPAVSVSELEARSTNGEILPLDLFPKRKGYPVALRSKWPGLVKSPYAQDKQMVDVSRFPPDSPVRCPHTGQIFFTPPNN
ncbi:MAG: hypothetical protein IT578_03055 [Verrucomicrobiae bacterium]|nr:hypothetical protein [Verrucomicrobiae bacterium]